MIKHVSASMLNSFSQCGYKAAQRYLFGTVLPYGISAKIGSAVHSAADDNNRSIIATGERLPLSELKEIVFHEYQSQINQGVFFSPEDQGTEMEHSCI